MYPGVSQMVHTAFYVLETSALISITNTEAKTYMVISYIK